MPPSASARQAAVLALRGRVALAAPPLRARPSRSISNSATGGSTSPATSTMYRTQINDRPGRPAALARLHVSQRPARRRPRLLPRRRLRHRRRSRRPAAPAGRSRSTCSSSTFTWRKIDHYSALPAFANPFLADGIIPGQQTYNRTRNIYDATLQLLPGQDAHADPRLHAEHLPRAGHDDVSPRQRRVPAEPNINSGRGVLPARARLRLRHGAGRDHAGLAQLSAGRRPSPWRRAPATAT